MKSRQHRAAFTGRDRIETHFGKYALIGLPAVPAAQSHRRPSHWLLVHHPGLIVDLISWCSLMGSRGPRSNRHGRVKPWLLVADSPVAGAPAKVLERGRAPEWPPSTEWASGQTELTPRQRVAFSPPVPLAPSPVLETASLSSLLPPFTALCLCWLATPFPADARRRLHSLKLVEHVPNKRPPYIPSFPSPSRSFLDASHQDKETARSGNGAIALSNPTTRSRRVSAQPEALLLNPTRTPTSLPPSRRRHNP